MVGKKDSEIPETIVLLIVFGVILYLAFLVLRPFILTMITAAVLAYITYPLYLRLEKTMGSKKVLASIIMILFVFIVVALPVSMIGTYVGREAVSGLNSLVDAAETAISLGGCEQGNSTLCVMLDQTLEFSRTEFFDRFVKGGLPQFSLISSGQGFFFSVTGFIVHFFIMLFVLFFMFIDGKNISQKFLDSLPLKRRYRDVLVNRFRSITSGVIYGQLLTSIIQGLVAALGFWIFQIKSPVLLGVLTAFTSMIPFLGAFSVWMPIATIKIIASAVSNDMSGVWMGIGLVIYGTVIISTIDNIIKPKFISDRAQLHPVLALVGVLGGISVFGIIGILLGPLIMALFISTLGIYKEHINQLR